jgi:predicted nucleic acid-binding protein
MARYLLDTDAIIDYLSGFAPSISLIQGLHERGDALCVCDVVVAEVYAGLLPKDKEKAQGLLSACVFLPTSLEAARLAGEWRYRYARQGRSVSTTDALVAATAHTHQSALVTANLDDYPMEEISLHPLPR